MGLRVQRLVCEDRKGLPGAGATTKVTMTRELIPAAMLMGEEKIGESFGPGYYEVWAIDNRNKFACGAPHVVRIADDSGEVPMYVRQFERADEETALEGAMSETEKVLRLQLAEADRRRADERTMWKELLAAQRTSHEADYQSISGLVDKVLQVQTMATAGARSEGEGGASSWFTKRVERIEKDLEAARAESRELAVKNAKKGGEAGEVDWFEKAIGAMPMVLDRLDKRQQLEERRLELEQQKLKVRSKTVVGGMILPTVDELREQLAGGWRPEGQPLAAFRELASTGMLPRIYEELLAPYLQPAPGESAG